MLLSLGSFNDVPVLSHVGTGSSSVTDPTRLPLENLNDPRTLVPCRFTTTAVTTTLAPDNRMVLTYSWGKPQANIVVAVLGHNVAHDDEFMVSIDGAPYADFDMTKINFATSAVLFANYGSKKNAYVYIPGDVNTLAFRFAAGNARVSGAAPPQLEIGRIWIGRGVDYSDLFGAAWSMRFLDGGKTDLSRVGGMFFSPATVLRELTIPLPALHRLQLISEPYLDDADDPLVATWSAAVRAAGMSREIVCMPRPSAAAWQRERMSIYGLLSASAQVGQQGLAATREDYWSGQFTLLERR